MYTDMAYGVDPRPIRRVVAVEALGDGVLSIRWADGETARVDLSGWIGLHDIAELRDAATFATAAVADYGSAVQWGEDEDLSIDSHHLSLIAEQQAPFGADDLQRWQDRLDLSNQEAADLLGVRLSTWRTYTSGEARIPRGVQIACQAVERDRLLFEAHYRPRRSGRPPKAA